MPFLDTERLRLVPITLEILEAVLDHDKPRAEALLGGAQFPGEWPNDDLVARAFPYSRNAIRAAPELRLWGDSFVLAKDEPRVIGSVVFHGHPAGHSSRYSTPVIGSVDDGEPGVAEVAYGIEEGSRGNGYAIEATRALVDWALAQDGITAVQATTFPWHLASLGVINRLGMVRAGTREHPLFGELLVFERRRAR